MATKLEHSVSYPFSTDRLWEVVTTEKYWRDLLEAINGDRGVLESFSHDGDTVTVEPSQHFPANYNCWKGTCKEHAIRLLGIDAPETPFETILSVAGSGAVTATATVEVSNDLAAAWVTFGTLSASGTAAAADAIVGTAPWAFHRARLDTITGTNAVATIAAAGV